MKNRPVILAEREAELSRHRQISLATAIALLGMVFPRPAVAQQPEIVTTVAFTEGPTVDGDGNVYFTEMVSLRIMKLSVNGVLSTFREHSNNANGLLIDPQGRLVACEGAGSDRTGVPRSCTDDLPVGRFRTKSSLGWKSLQW